MFKFLSLFLILTIAILSQNLPFTDSFENGSLEDWNIVDDQPAYSGPSDWFTDAGVLRQTSNIWAYAAPDEFKYHLGTHIVTGSSEWVGYSVNALVRSTDDDGIGMIFNYQDKDNYYRILLLQDANNGGPVQRIQKFVNGEPVLLFEKTPAQAVPSGWFSLTVDSRNDSIRFYINSEFIGETTDTDYSSGKAGFFCYANSGAYFDSVMVSHDRIIYQAPENTEVLADRLPYIQLTEKESAAITWRTKEKFTGRVEYGIDANFGNVVFEDSATSKHIISLTGLTPGTKYYYRVYNDDVLYFEGSSFATKPDDNQSDISFLVWGDSGTGNDAQASVTNVLEPASANVDFALHVGDVSQGQGDEYDEIYFKPYKNIVDHLNVFTCIGNHDTYADNAATYLDNFYYHANNEANTERYYSFRWGKMFFINLDSNIDFSPGSPQYRFFADELKNMPGDILWKVVYFHHPAYCELWEGYDGTKEVRQYLLPLFELYDVDLVLNGHTHGYEHGELKGVNYVITGGGGGALDPYARDWPFITVSESIHHYSRVNVTGEKFSFEAVGINGEVIDSFVIDKNVSPVENETQHPKSYKLFNNYPNPFNPSTEIKFELPEDAHVKIEVTNLLGEKVAILADGEKNAGVYSLTFNSGGLPSGIYFCRMVTGKFTSTRKMVLIK